MKSFLRFVASAAAVLSALVVVSGSRPVWAQIPGQMRPDVQLIVLAEFSYAAPNRLPRKTSSCCNL